MLYFGAVRGDYTLDIQLGNELDLVSILQDKGQPQAITEMVLTLPLGKVIYLMGCYSDNISCDNTRFVLLYIGGNYDDWTQRR